jgi:DUF1365 family protein
MSRDSASALYLGQVRHRRLAPRAHTFRYPLFLTYLDLAELDTVFAGRWLWSTEKPRPFYLKRSDYLGDPESDLDTAVRDLVEAETGTRPAGPIRLLTHLRTFGHCFNPVSLYYCFDASGKRLETLVAEVSNTPWRERHCYVMPVEDDLQQGGTITLEAEKRFHVSPFLPMAMSYRWRITQPGSRALVHIENLEDEKKVFDATMELSRREITGPNLARVLARFPFLTLRVVLWIHWEALKLWLKKIPFYPHPKHQSSSPS